MTPEPIIKNISYEYDYEYFQQDDVCRLCWKRNAITDIFDKNINTVPENTLSYKIKQCLDIELSQNLFPKKVCDNCRQKIEKFYIYKVFCQETDRNLQEIVKNHLETPVVCKDEVKTELELNDEQIEPFNETESFDRNSGSNEDTKPKKRKRRRYGPTYCKVCKKDFDDTNKFAKHNLKYHRIENGQYKCFGCEKKFKSRKRCISHETNFCKALADGYKCAPCGRFLPNRRSYEVHMRNHRQNGSIDLPENIFECRHCYTFYKTKDELNKHLLEHGGKKNNFVCEKCGRVFTRRDYLYKHTFTHTGEKRHVCPHCDFRTTQRSSLVLHIRCHTGERPYQCDVCPQRCVSSSNLRAHRRKHHGLKEHECTICGKRFGYKVTLAEHVCAAHAPAPQTCTLCAARFTRPRALARHMRAKHPQTTQDDSKVVQQIQIVQHDSQLLQEDSQT